MIPKETSVAMCDFPDVRSAANVVFDVIHSGIQIGAIEILDEVMMKCVNQAYPKQKLAERPTLYFKFSGHSKQQVESDIKQVGEIARKYRAGKFRFAKSEAEKAELWEGRKVRNQPDLFPNDGLLIRTTSLDMFMVCCSYAARKGYLDYRCGGARIEAG